MKNKMNFLTKKPFAPLFWTQVLGAFNDNIFKSALIIAITYKTKGNPAQLTMLTTLTAGLFVCPFFLFSTTAGFLSDKLEKSKLIQKIKILEIAIMVLGGIGFLIHNLYFLIGVIFLMGTQSAFFGPIKYAILPDLTEEKHLFKANALVEASTFLAILLGSIMGSTLMTTPRGDMIIPLLCIVTASLGCIASFQMPAGKAKNPTLQISWRFVQQTYHMISFARQHKTIWMSILGISSFWTIGAIFLTHIATFTKNVIAGSPAIVTLFLTLMSLGIGLGSSISLYCQKGWIGRHIISFSSLGMSVFILDLVWSAHSMPASLPHTIVSLDAFIRTPIAWRLIADFTALFICGGIFSIPLYTLIQIDSSEDTRARIIASNNILNAFGMVLASIVIIGLFQWHFSILQVFLTVGVLNIGMAYYMWPLSATKVLYHPKTSP